MDTVCSSAPHRISDKLGSGEFGDVASGYWKSADYSLEVALKTLSGKQSLDGRKRLLQEAAIMSQFKHPNVVKLYGVVCDDEKVLYHLHLSKTIQLEFFLPLSLCWSLNF